MSAAKYQAQGTLGLELFETIEDHKNSEADAFEMVETKAVKTLYMPPLGEQNHTQVTQPQLLQPQLAQPQLAHSQQGQDGHTQLAQSPASSPTTSSQGVSTQQTSSNVQTISNVQATSNAETTDLDSTQQSAGHKDLMNLGDLEQSGKLETTKSASILDSMLDIGVQNVAASESTAENSAPALSGLGVVGPAGGVTTSNGLVESATDDGAVSGKNLNSNSSSNSISDLAGNSIGSSSSNSIINSVGSSGGNEASNVAQNTSKDSLDSDFDPFEPLAERLRPRNIDEYIGQSHLLGPDKPLRKALERHRCYSMIFWGPPGVGKTTLALMLAKATGAVLEQLSAVVGGMADIREAVARAKERRRHGLRTILFVDEVHRFNKAQQDAFLPHIENGTIIFVGATTENPSFQVNSALLSRARVFVLKKLSETELSQLLDMALNSERGLKRERLVLDNKVREALISLADGDARHLLTTLEMLADDAAPLKDGSKQITYAMVGAVAGRRLLSYDKNGDAYYDLISAFHKSVRGSAPDAALYWYARILEAGGDPSYVARRILAIATEDVGLADPNAMQIALNAWDIFNRVGAAEGERAIAEAAVYMALAPKSNHLYTAFNQVRQDVVTLPSYDVPLYIRNAPTKLMSQLGYHDGYRYAHDFPGAYAPGECFMPEELHGKRYYIASDRGFECYLKQRQEYLAHLDALAPSQQRYGVEHAQQVQQELKVRYPQIFENDLLSPKDAAPFPVDPQLMGQHKARMSAVKAQIDPAVNAADNVFNPQNVALGNTQNIAQGNFQNIPQANQQNISQNIVQGNYQNTSQSNSWSTPQARQPSNLQFQQGVNAPANVSSKPAPESSINQGLTNFDSTSSLVGVQGYAPIAPLEQTQNLVNGSVPAYNAFNPQVPNGQMPMPALENQSRVSPQGEDYASGYGPFAGGVEDLGRSNNLGVPDGVQQHGVNTNAPFNANLNANYNAPFNGQYNADASVETYTQQQLSNMQPLPIQSIQSMQSLQSSQPMQSTQSMHSMQPMQREQASSPMLNPPNMQPRQSVSPMQTMQPMQAMQSRQDRHMGSEQQFMQPQGHMQRQS